MGDNNRYYWIKLKTDFFNQQTIDFLLSQKNGCEYIVLYQMLCLNTANNNGEMCSKIGEMIVPYNVEKIVRDTKYFDFDTVTIALELFKKLGLIYEEEDKILKITNFNEMVGSEAGNPNAQRQKRFRERQKQLKLSVINSNANSNAKNNEEIDIDIRDRDKSIDKDINIENNNNNNNYNYIYNNNSSSSDEIINFIESNFGRTLSSYEFEKINCWLNEFDSDIVKHAIELSILNNKRTFAYIEGILKNWKSCGYKTLNDIKNEDVTPKHKTKEELKKEYAKMGYIYE